VFAHALCSALVALLIVPIAAADPQQDVTLHVEVRDRLLSVRAVDVPLEDVLREVGKKAGLRLQMVGGLRHVDREGFTGLPFPDALRSLAGHNGLVMIYGRDKADGQSRLEEVRVYSEPQDIRQAEKTKSKALANAPLHVVQLLPPGEAEWPSPKVLGSVSATAAKMPVFRVPKASRIPQERSR
jgi:hypothetical protein